MNIVFIPKRNGKITSLMLDKHRMVAIVGGVALLSVLIALSGYWMGKQDSEVGSDALLDQWGKQMQQQRAEVNSAKQGANEQVNALSRRLGELQAHVIRLEALGSRLVALAGLDAGEFDFDNQPAQGGPVHSEQVKGVKFDDFLASLNQLSTKIESRTQQLGVLESMLVNRKVQDKVQPRGRPVQKGWMSSFFGMRTDPFTGLQEHHKGVDFAGKMGSNVVSVASGVVTWAGSRYGYGNLVEVNHGNGYATRYGHNQKILVKVGDTVKKGQVISLMGSTGRSTGPHVHFEVWHKGKTVDPMKYIKNRH